ncbi:GNAT family N-acetyltransferase [Paenibacillus riograndensis]
MSSAFARDPLFLHLFGDSELDNKARSRVTAFVSFMFDKSFLLHEEVWGYFIHERLLGAYVVEKPHAGIRQTMKGVLLLGRLIPLLFQVSGQTLHLLNSYIRVTRAAAPPLLHHYLIMIGVKPEAQGKGVGTALLKHLLETVNTDKQSQGLALDTENKRNIALYQNFGFTLSKDTQVGQIPVYCMFYQK